MAVLMAPTEVDWSGSDEPKTTAVVVPAANIMPGGGTAIYGNGSLVLMFPSRDQIVGTSGAGYSQ